MSYSSCSASQQYYSYLSFACAQLKEVKEVKGVKEVKEVKSPPTDLRITNGFILFMALKRMGAFCKKVVLGFRSGR